MPGAQYLLLRCLHLWTEGKSGGNKCSTLQLPKNLSADIDKVFPLHFTAFGRWCKNSRMPTPFREAASAWWHTRKTVSVLPLNITVFKARQSMRCPSCLQRGEMTKCFNGTKCTHMERLRADPSTGLCIVQCSRLPCSLPKPRCYLHTYSAKELSQDRQEQKATPVLSPRGDF